MSGDENIIIFALAKRGGYPAASLQDWEEQENGSK
jgi:hypothetical protein